MAKPKKPTVYKSSKVKSRGSRGDGAGEASRYTTRNKALTTLQIKLPEFRRLCILKGIHPREPKKKFAGHNKTYYHVKDIKFLAYEPLLEQGRETKAYEKKVKKARAKKNEDLARRLDRLRPHHSLDHLVKERYPSFVDALRDMDDALTMLHLFATLPSDSNPKIPVERTNSARRLILEWQAYVIRTHALRKTFVSVKGLYYQAEVSGQKITWLVPHALSQVLPTDVDYRVMLTFVEFYETLIGFVNFKLYHSLGIRYPPIIPPQLAQAAAGIDELMAVIGDGGNGVDEEVGETSNCANLFKNLKFFLAREVQRDSLLLVLYSFGGTVSWDADGAPFDESDEEITHQIVDRPTQGHKFFTRDYVQPQWVYDCANARILLPTEAYTVGKIPPPHLSPFVDNEAEGYIPEYGDTIKRLQEASANSHRTLPIGEDEEMDDPDSIMKTGRGQHREEAEEAAKEAAAAAEEKAYEDDLANELARVPYSSAAEQVQIEMETSTEGDASMPNAEREEGVAAVETANEEDQKLAHLMMPKRTRGLYKAMQMGKEKKKASVDLLKQRKRKVEERRKAQNE